MAWSDVRTRLATDLATVAITSPVAETVKRVYTFPPRIVQDYPAFIIYPPTVRVERGPSGRRIKHVVVRIRFVFADEDLDTAAEYLDAYREAVIDMFDTEIALGLTGGVQHIVGPDVQEVAGFKFGDRDFIGQDFLLSMQIKDNVTYAH